MNDLIPVHEELPRCQGKVSYQKKLGETVRNRQLKQGARDLRLYRCPLCNYWHLTHSKGKR